MNILEVSRFLEDSALELEQLSVELDDLALIFDDQYDEESKRLAEISLRLYQLATR